MTRARRSCVRAAVLVGLCLAAAQCDNAPSAPTHFLSGVWTGTLQSSISDRATARLLITDVGSSLTGSWSVDATSVTGANGGRLFGTVVGSSVLIGLTSNDPLTCSFDVTATITGNTLTGTYDTFNCTAGLSGSISVTRATTVFEDP